MLARCTLFCLALFVAIGQPLCSSALAADAAAPGADAAAANGADAPVSYYKQIRPIFQANCHGCHQPAKSKGKYVMTDFSRLLAGGSSGDAAVVAGQPDKSFLVDQITPLKGEAEMPKDRKPLSDADITLIRRWISQGALDDTPANARQRFDKEHPPVYTRPPVITSIDFSPDGSLLAVAGFHEVLLMQGDGSSLVARLVGVSQRVESVRFSPDGSQLAVTGGLPGRMGEVQVWDVAKRSLVLSVPVTYDTVYGASWSPDGKVIAFGCADNTVRAVDAKSGEQVLYQGAHNDWVLDTVFSVDGKYLVSVGRDMTAKLIEFSTQRFIDNITSITPGALKGGILSVARHPTRDEIVIGGSDGIVKVYRMQRLTKRVIGDDANMIRQMPAMRGRVFSVAVSADGKRIAAGSSLDGAGQVHVYGYEFDTGLPADIKKINEKVVTSRSAAEKEALKKFHEKEVKLIASLDVPEAGVYAVAFRPDGKAIAAAGADGKVRVIDAASGKLINTFSPAPMDKPATSVVRQPAKVDFIRDVNPVLSRVGCNAGTCHGSAKGKNGFKLSLRGYDALFDVRALTDDHASRRVNVASPDDSLMLLKCTGAVPHEGGQVIKPDEPYYRIIRDWIASGAKLDLTTPRVTGITISPTNPVLAMPGNAQPMKVTATYADGMTRDVTRDAFIDSGDTEIAKADRQGVLTAVRRGEAPVLARYEGAYTATTLTVMGDRSGFVWHEPPTWGKIDELVAAKWQRMKIQPSELCTDAQFIRRVYLDLTGLPPTADDVRSFMADTRDTRVKRDELVDRLVGSDEYIDYWTNKWADLLQVNRKFLGAQGAAAFRDWIRGELVANTPYDDFARKILTATGSNKDNPAASYYKILREPDEIMENTTHLFLAVRFNCNKCHDHPFERWTQDQYYQTAAWFARVDLQRDPASGKNKIGGTAVEGAKPLYEIVVDKDAGEVMHSRTNQVAKPQFPFQCKHEAPKDASRRQELAAWVTSPDNPYFAKSYVNRLWGYLFGVGIREPIDDLRAGNPPTNPQLLDYLTQQFIDGGFDVPKVMRMICKSRTYQLSFRVNEWNGDDKLNYSHALPRRLPAEPLYDALHRVTGSVSNIPGVPAGTRAAALPDVGVKLPSGFLGTFGRPARESACECERSNDLQLGPVMALISGPTVADAIADPNNAIAKLVASEPDDRKLIDELFLRILNRPATDREVQATLEEMAAIDEDNAAVVKALQKREAELAPTIAQQEEARQKAIADVKADLDAYEKQIAPKQAELEKQRLAKVADLEARLKAFEADLPAKLAQWEQQQKAGVKWTALEATSLKATNNAKLAKEADGVVFASGPNGKGAYEFIAQTDLAGITAVRLELFADDRLPGKGPGRAPNGNFVLSEFDLQWAPMDKPDKFTKAPLQNAVADFSQKSYDVATAIDGKAPPQNNGWATHPNVGQNRTAVFQTTADLGKPSGSVLKFTLNQQYQDGQHTIGRFRISVTTAPRPVNLGPPADVAAILAVAPDKRSKEQNDALVKHFRQASPTLRQLTADLAAARKPLPIDPGLKERRETLARVSQPLPIDPKLVQLRSIVQMSAKQVENKRLTIAQDLTWALINSPAFLFNH